MIEVNVSDIHANCVCDYICRIRDKELSLRLETNTLNFGYRPFTI